MSINQNKYCCSWFEILHKQPKSSDCIRLFKINSCALAKLEIHYATNDSGKKRFVEYSDVQYRFFLMAALHPSKQKYDKLFGGYSLSFCPCCGTNLYDFYLKKRNANDYVNEIEGKTF